MRPLIAAAAALIAAAPRSAAAQVSVVVFEDVTVLPMDSARVLPHHSVLVRDGRIAAVGPAAAVRVPAGALRVDGRGKYLMPGLAEMHAHLPNPDAPNTPPEIVERVLFLYVANGVTVARGMLGNAAHLAIRDSIARGRLLGPRLWVAGPPLGGNQATTPAIGRTMVEDQHTAGYDHAKIQEGLSLDTYDTIVATARRLGMRFAGHVPDAVPLAYVLASGQATIDHLDNYVATVGGPDAAVSDSAVAAVVAATRAAGTWMVPTMALWETFFGDVPVDRLRQRPELRYVPATWVDTWAGAVRNLRAGNDSASGRRTLALRRRLLNALAAGGVGILLGTDSPQLFSVPGFSIHRELQAMAQAGLTPFQILQAGTVNVARFYGATDDFGTVASGRRADLLLLDGDPLADLGNVARRAGVMVAGHWLPETEIQARLAGIAAHR